MLNKNDPLIGAVQEVMKRNHAEREAARLVNEKFGITDRKALPHERQGEWDSAYQKVISESASLAALAPPHNKVTKKDVLVGRGVLKKHPTQSGKHVLAKEEQLEEKKMSDAEMAKREKIVKSMKKKMSGFKSRYGERAKDVMYATATKQAMKEDNEGFNNRHSLSEKVSAEKQAVAVQLSERSAGIILGKEKEKRKQQAAANKKMTSRIQAREPKELSNFERFQAREKQSPTKVIGGSPVAPIGGPATSLAKMAIRNAPGLLSRAYSYLRNRAASGQTQPQSNLAAGAARRTNQSVPSVTSSPGSATGRLPASGPFGSIRDVSKVTRRGGDARASGGGPSGTMTSAARLQAIRRPSSGTATTSARPAASGRPATSSTQLAQAVSRNKAVRVAQAGAKRVPQTAFSNEIPAIDAAPKTAQADTSTAGPEKIKTSTQTTTTQPDYDKMTFGQAFKTARQQVGGASGKFKYKGKEYQTNIQGTGTAKKPQEKYQPANKLKTVAPAPETKTTTSVVGGQGIAAVPGGTSSAAAKPVPSAAKERANFAGPPAGQNRQKDNSYLMSGAFPKMDTFRDKGRYAGDMRDTKGPAAAERLANPTFVPRPSPGVIRTPSKTFGGPK